jgi:DNA mismatch repair protein MutL
MPIRVLDNHLIDQIAAGEVIERPASIVKELVENSLDAGAQSVDVEIEAGGVRLTRVRDDGEGIPAEELQLALSRHATSKVSCADDLAAITTLGFRGEALPSIASVSRFEITSRHATAERASCLAVDAGTFGEIKPAAHPRGTTIEVRDLFFNLPARRKFLKSDGAESAHVSKVVTQLALCHPAVGVTLTSAGRKVLQCPPARSLEDRLFQIYGDRPDLVAVARETHGVRLTGVVAALADQGPTRGPQHVFVNRRVVRDKTIAHAILDAYQSASIKERSPEVHLFLEVPLDRVDVNVHPTKAEVRFADQSLVHEIVRRGIAEALGAATMPGLPAAVVAVAGEGGGLQMWPAPPAPAWAAVAPPALGEWMARDRPEPASEPPAWPEPAGTGGIGLTRPLEPLGQFRNTFILAVDDDGIVIVDQHVAHERVLFERILERLTTTALETQGLLVPMVLDLPGAGHATLLARSAELARFGFEIEDFGGASLRVTAVPALLAAADVDRALRALADDLDGVDRGLAAEQAMKQIAATMACHAAVKAHDPLTLEKMRHILEELRATAYSTVCPHGRPVMFRISRRDLERRFERI